MPHRIPPAAVRIFTHRKPLLQEANRRPGEDSEPWFPPEPSPTLFSPPAAAVETRGSRTYDGCCRYEYREHLRAARGDWDPSPGTVSGRYQPGSECLSSAFHCPASGPSPASRVFRPHHPDAPMEQGSAYTPYLLLRAEAYEGAAPPESAYEGAAAKTYTQGHRPSRHPRRDAVAAALPVHRHDGACAAHLPTRYASSQGSYLPACSRGGRACEAGERDGFSHIPLGGVEEGRSSRRGSQCAPGRRAEQGPEARSFADNGARARPDRTLSSSSTESATSYRRGDREPGPRRQARGDWNAGQPRESRGREGRVRSQVHNENEAPNRSPARQKKGEVSGRASESHRKDSSCGMPRGGASKGDADRQPEASSRNPSAHSALHSGAAREPRSHYDPQAAAKSRRPGGGQLRQAPQRPGADSESRRRPARQAEESDRRAALGRQRETQRDTQLRGASAQAPARGCRGSSKAANGRGAEELAQVSAGDDATVARGSWGVARPVVPGAQQVLWQQTRRRLMTRRLTVEEERAVACFSGSCDDPQALASLSADGRSEFAECIEARRHSGCPPGPVKIHQRQTVAVSHVSPVLSPRASSSLLFGEDAKAPAGAFRGEKGRDNPGKSEASAAEMQVGYDGGDEYWETAETSDSYQKDDKDIVHFLLQEKERCMRRLERELDALHVEHRTLLALADGPALSTACLPSAGGRCEEDVAPSRQARTLSEPSPELLPPHLLPHRGVSAHWGDAAREDSSQCVHTHAGRSCRHCHTSEPVPHADAGQLLGGESYFPAFPLCEDAKGERGEAGGMYPCTHADTSNEHVWDGFSGHAELRNGRRAHSGWKGLRGKGRGDDLSSHPPVALRAAQPGGSRQTGRGSFASRASEAEVPEGGCDGARRLLDASRRRAGPTLLQQRHSREGGRGGAFYADIRSRGDLLRPPPSCPGGVYPAYLQEARQAPVQQPGESELERKRMFSLREETFPDGGFDCVQPLPQRQRGPLSCGPAERLRSRVPSRSAAGRGAGRDPPDARNGPAGGARRDPRAPRCLAHPGLYVPSLSRLCTAPAALGPRGHAAPQRPACMRCGADVHEPSEGRGADEIHADSRLCAAAACGACLRPAAAAAAWSRGPREPLPPQIPRACERATRLQAFPSWLARGDGEHAYVAYYRRCDAAMREDAGGEGAHSEAECAADRSPSFDAEGDWGHSRAPRGPPSRREGRRRREERASDRGRARGETVGRSASPTASRAASLSPETQEDAGSAHATAERDRHRPVARVAAAILRRVKARQRGDGEAPDPPRRLRKTKGGAETEDEQEDGVTDAGAWSEDEVAGLRDLSGPLQRMREDGDSGVWRRDRRRGGSRARGERLENRDASLGSRASTGFSDAGLEEPPQAFDSMQEDAAEDRVPLSKKRTRCGKLRSSRGAQEEGEDLASSSPVPEEGRRRGRKERRVGGRAAEGEARLEESKRPDIAPTDEEEAEDESRGRKRRRRKASVAKKSMKSFGAPVRRSPRLEGAQAQRALGREDARERRSQAKPSERRTGTGAQQPAAAGAGGVQMETEPAAGEAHTQAVSTDDFASNWGEDLPCEGDPPLSPASSDSRLARRRSPRRPKSTAAPQPGEEGPREAHPLDNLPASLSSLGRRGQTRREKEDNLLVSRSPPGRPAGAADIPAASGGNPSSHRFPLSSQDGAGSRSRSCVASPPEKGASSASSPASTPSRRKGEAAPASQPGGSHAGGGAPSRSPPACEPPAKDRAAALKETLGAAPSQSRRRKRVLRAAATPGKEEKGGRRVPSISSSRGPGAPLYSAAALQRLRREELETIPSPIVTRIRLGLSDRLSLLRQKEKASEKAAEESRAPPAPQDKAPPAQSQSPTQCGGEKQANTSGGDGGRARERDSGDSERAEEAAQRRGEREEPAERLAARGKPCEEEEEARVLDKTAFADISTRGAPLAPEGANSTQPLFTPLSSFASSSFSSEDKVGRGLAEGEVRPGDLVGGRLVRRGADVRNRVFSSTLLRLINGDMRATTEKDVHLFITNYCLEKGLQQVRSVVNGKKAKKWPVGRDPLLRVLFGDGAKAFPASKPEMMECLRKNKHITYFSIA
ncbi:hypothetical protein BESB_056190 [Besnoitia besnoiti]|uniref:Uncharacterized protein n=1 Tax=Besnoitia besnoiti TaxID=94643 RepID=A0A2A9MBW7_BESBE|nr:hypothetical protein BESB_056190 [Besnoitia besnoiti]PFH35968.1 hypothetical protein BESB_056190 [Besnoitia besnoiti]